MNGSKLSLTFAQLRRLAASPKAWLELGRYLRQRLVQPLDLGVRGIVLDSEGRVLLLRHTYVPGWYLPGGGVEPGETLAEALERELGEEANICLDAPPVLHGLFLKEGRRTHHVACFVVRGFHQTRPRLADWEIAETGFFHPKLLPEDTSPATRARLAEVLENLPPARTW